MAVSIPQTSEEFNECTWSQINDLAASAAADPEPFQFWFTQDFQKEFEYQGATYHARVIDAAHYDLADGSGKAGLSFEFVELLPEKYRMNETNTNAGGYPETEMYKTTLPSIAANMPKEMSDLFVTVKLPYNICVDKDGVGDDGFTIAETTENFYLHSYCELFGHIKEYGVDGTRFAWYEQHNAESDRTKYYDNGGTPDTHNWWLRSTMPSTTHFCLVQANGKLTSSLASHLLYHLSPGFSIGRPPLPDKAVSLPQAVEMISAGLSLINISGLPLATVDHPGLIPPLPESPYVDDYSPDEASVTATSADRT